MNEVYSKIIQKESSLLFACGTAFGNKIFVQSTALVRIKSALTELIFHSQFQHFSGQKYLTQSLVVFGILISDLFWDIVSLLK